MIRKDIFGALRNGIERGESLEEAKLSLVNAGYSREEVEEAAGAMLVEGNEENLPVIEAGGQGQQEPGPISSSSGNQENFLAKIINAVKKDIVAIILGVVFLLLIAGLVASFVLIE